MTTLSLQTLKATIFASYKRESLELGHGGKLGSKPSCESCLADHLPSAFRLVLVLVFSVVGLVARLAEA